MKPEHAALVWYGVIPQSLSDSLMVDQLQAAAVEDPTVVAAINDARAVFHEHLDVETYTLWLSDRGLGPINPAYRGKLELFAEQRRTAAEGKH